MKRIVLIAASLLALMAVVASAQEAGFGNLYYDGSVVRTVVPPASMPNAGIENLYAIPDGAPGQLAVVATAPGAPGYRGGKWAFHLVAWNTTPYLLTSESAVLAAEGTGDVTITRIPGNDFKCPVQP